MFFRERSQLEALQEELQQTKAELSQVRVQLAQKEKVSTPVMPYNDKVVLTPFTVDISYFFHPVNHVCQTLARSVIIFGPQGSTKSLRGPACQYCTAHVI